MKTIKDLVDLNDVYSAQILSTIGYDPDIRFTSIYDVLKSFKYNVKLIGNIKDISIYTNKDICNMSIPQVMELLVSIDRRYNILVVQDV